MVDSVKSNPEERTQIYYKKDEAFQRQQQKLIDWPGSAKNKQLIQAFQEHLFSIGTGQYRTAKLTASMRWICDALQDDLDKATKTSIQSVVAKINTTATWGEHSKSDYRRTLKQFYHWYEEEDPRVYSKDEDARNEAARLYRYLQKDVRGKPREQIKDRDIITEEDIHLLIQKGCARPLERAIIAFLHETGCRVGELLNLRIQDIEFKGRHAMVRLNGKTGERNVPIVQSLPYIVRWLEDHPHKENPRSLLWISTHSAHYGQALRYIGVTKILKAAFLRAGVRKTCNPHWFRHSRATILSPHYSDVLRCKLMGWTLGSKQVRTYTKMAAVDVEEKFLQNHGLQDQDKPEERVKICGCGTTNERTARYCYRCGNALSVAIMLEDEQKKTAAVEEAIQEYMRRILNNPDELKKFETYKSNRDRKVQ